jgi:hypothetical protein
MLVPNTLEDWTYEVVKELVAIGQIETDRHDFKFNFSEADYTQSSVALLQTHGADLL